MNTCLVQSCTRRPKSWLVFIFIPSLIFLSVTIIFLLVTKSPDSSFPLTKRSERASKYSYDDTSNRQADDLALRIADLKRIRLSVRNQLFQMEKEKQKLIKDKQSIMSKNEKLNNLIIKSKSQLKQLELDIAADRRQKFEKTCDISERTSLIVFRPLKAADIAQYATPNEAHLYKSPSSNETGGNESSKDGYLADYSLCPLTGEFRFSLQPIDTVNNNIQLTEVDVSTARQILASHRQYTDDNSNSCLSIHLTSQVNPHRSNLVRSRNLVTIVLPATGVDIIDYPKDSIIAASSFRQNVFRHNIDLLLPSIWQRAENYDSILGSIPPQSPIERKYLASYFGSSVKDPPNANSAHNLNQLEKTLQIMHRNSIDDLFLFIYDCRPNSEGQCYEEREKMMESSIFNIIIIGPQHVLDANSNDLLYLSLSRASIPVIIGKERLRLPFDEVLDWRKAAVLLPTARLPELHFILRSINAADLYQLKYHGRRIFENHLATSKQILHTTISILGTERFNFPPPPIQNVETVTYNRDYKLIVDTNCTTDACIEAKMELQDEILGPREKPFNSKRFTRNFSLVLTSSYELWNSPKHSPFHLYPSLPADPVPPSEYKFVSSEQGYRPIANGLGGSGVEFSRSIGGDYPNEQFTIVLMTYERNTLLLKTLERLKGLAYLNKIVIVWNGINHSPPVDMIWTDVGVPIVLVKAERNSLNNRFLPYDAIETDAIFSMDDDIPLRADEIVFAFRVWRQSRDRIVGFPARYHGWDANRNSWLYNSNHSCEISMVLTGGAFFHKFYTYMYTFNMPSAIRAIVDKFMNCEDIAMNFLVAHMTRQPPIKVTSRWTFRCAGCANSLSDDDSHFRERHECLNTFSSIYGYMPLLSTQHRSDSILFKTRLPHDKQKCFKYV